MYKDVFLSLIPLVLGIAAVILAHFLTALIRSRGKRSIYSHRGEREPNDLRHRYAILYDKSGSVTELPISKLTNILFQESTENADLEYKIAVLEGYVDWMLANGAFEREIDQHEIDKIRSNASLAVKQRFPKVEIEIKETQDT